MTTKIDQGKKDSHKLSDDDLEKVVGGFNMPDPIIHEGTEGDDVLQGGDGDYDGLNGGGGDDVLIAGTGGIPWPLWWRWRRCFAWRRSKSQSDGRW